MPTRAATLARAADLRARFETAGAVPVETPILQPAGTLLDLYGEDIRARAYVTSDALRGEQMLRPDFTVPVVQMHMAHGAEPARYTYAGEVFRRQEEDPDRPNEYVQVGYEVFDRANPAGADAEVFALIAGILAPLSLRAVTGDIGLLMAAVQGLANHRCAQIRTAAPYLAAPPVSCPAGPVFGENTRAENTQRAVEEKRPDGAVRPRDRPAQRARDRGAYRRPARRRSHCADFQRRGGVDRRGSGRA